MADMIYFMSAIFKKYIGGITMSVKLICDSLCDIPDEIQEKEYLEVVPLTLVMDGIEYKDGVDITKDEFYEKSVRAKEIPKTSQATYLQFKEVFERAISNGDDVLCINGASGSSGTYQSAMLSKNDVEGEIYVYDTEELSLGAGQYVIRACDMIEDGLSAAQIVKKLDDIKKKGVQILFAPASFDFLKKSGRVPLATALIGNMLNIKPLFKMELGSIEFEAKVRGIKKLVTKMVDLVLERNIQDLASTVVTIGCGSNLESYKKLKIEVENRLKDKVKKVLVTKGGVCICSHTGPDIIAISFSK